MVKQGNHRIGEAFGGTLHGIHVFVVFAEFLFSREAGEEDKG